MEMLYSTRPCFVERGKRASSVPLLTHYRPVSSPLGLRVLSTHASTAGPCVATPQNHKIVSLYFIFLFWVTKPELKDRSPVAAAAAPAPPEATVGYSMSASDRSRENTEKFIQNSAATAVPKRDGDDVVRGVGETDDGLPMTKNTVAYSLTAASVLCLAGEFIAKVAFGGRVSPM